MTPPPLKPGRLLHLYGQHTDKCPMNQGRAWCDPNACGLEEALALELAEAERVRSLEARLGELEDQLTERAERVVDEVLRLDRLLDDTDASGVLVRMEAWTRLVEMALKARGAGPPELRS